MPPSPAHKKTTLSDILGGPHLHWEFAAAKSREGDRLIDQTLVHIYGQLDEAAARAAAERIIVRPVWHLMRVWECKSCGIQDENIRLTNEMLKRQKKNLDDHSM